MLEVMTARGTQERAQTVALVLGTVNAPYSEKLSGAQLAHCLRDPAAARAAPGHMSSFFFVKIEPDLQFGFARLFDITDEELVSAARAFAMYSGESYPLAA